MPTFLASALLATAGTVYLIATRPKQRVVVVPSASSDGGTVSAAWSF